MNRTKRGFICTSDGVIANVSLYWHNNLYRCYSIVYYWIMAFHHSAELTYRICYWIVFMLHYTIAVVCEELHWSNELVYYHQQQHETIRSINNLVVKTAAYLCNRLRRRRQSLSTWEEINVEVNTSLLHKLKVSTIVEITRTLDHDRSLIKTPTARNIRITIDVMLENDMCKLQCGGLRPRFGRLPLTCPWRIRKSLLFRSSTRCYVISQQGKG